jgi:hypothetical protein
MLLILLLCNKIYLEEKISVVLVHMRYTGDMHKKEKREK